MAKQAANGRVSKKSNEGWFFGELKLNGKVASTQTAKLLKSKRLLMAVLSVIITLIAILLRYNQKTTITPLVETGKYVKLEDHEKVKRDRDEWEAKCQELEAWIDDHVTVRDSLHTLWKELESNVLIYPQRSRTEINKHVQRILRACRAYDGPIDGDPINTYHKVKDFQRTKGLKKIDGIIGPETWNYTIEELETVVEKPGSLESYKYPL